MCCIRLRHGRRPRQSVEQIFGTDTLIKKPTEKGPSGRSLLPEPSVEGSQALDRVLESCRASGCLTRDEGKGVARSRFEVRGNPEDVRAVVAAHPEILTPALRDAVVVRCFATYHAPPPQKEVVGPGALGRALSRAIAAPQAPRTTDRISHSLGAILLGTIGTVKEDGRGPGICRRPGRAGEGARGPLRCGPDRIRTGDATLRRREGRGLGGLLPQQSGHSLRSRERWPGRWSSTFARSLGHPGVPGDHPSIATCLENMGRIDIRQHAQCRGAAVPRGGPQDRSRTPGDNRTRVAASRISLGDHLRQTWGPREWLEQFRGSLAVWKSLLRESRPGQADLIEMIPSDPTFNMDEAIEDFPALSCLRQVFGDDASGIAAILDRIGDVYLRQDRPADA